MTKETNVFSLSNNIVPIQLQVTKFVRLLGQSTNMKAQAQMKKTLADGAGRKPAS